MNNCIFVYGFNPNESKHKKFLLDLVKNSPHNVNPFKPDFIIKAINYPCSSKEEFSGLFLEENGVINKNEVLVLGCAYPEPDFQDIWYLHEMTGFIKGYGKKYFECMLKKYPKCYGEVALIGDGESEPYRTNEKLFDFYKSIPSLKFKRVYSKDYGCDRIFLFSKSISNAEMNKLVEGK